MSNQETNFTDSSTDIIRHDRFVKQQGTIKELLELSSLLGRPQILGIEGRPDVGVTTMLNDFCQSYSPKVEAAKNAVLFVTTPALADIPMLGKAMLRGIGDLQANTYNDIGLINLKLINLIKDCKTPLIILDNFHYLLEAGTVEVYGRAGNWIKYLAEATETPFVLAGVEGTLSKMRQANPELVGLFEVEKFEPFAWDPNSREIIQEFGDLLYAMEEIVGLDLPWRHGKDVDLVYRMYYATSGTVGAVKRLMMIAANKARQKGGSRIEMETLRHVFQEQIKRGLKKAHNPFDKKWGDWFNPT